MLRLGLTGGIGSGKSTVASLLAQHGGVVVDADAVSRGLTAPGGAALPEIRRVFGGDVFNARGQLDRDALRQRVFAHTAQRHQLEQIIHPMVREHMTGQVTRAGQQGAPFVVLDIPLLAESPHWRDRLDAIVVVDCTASTQIQRVMARNGLTREQVQAIVAAQACREDRLALADAVIFNDGLDLLQLKHGVAQLVKHFGL